MVNTTFVGEFAYGKRPRRGGRGLHVPVYIYCAVTVKATVELCTTLPALVEATPVTVT